MIYRLHKTSNNGFRILIDEQVHPLMAGFKTHQEALGYFQQHYPGKALIISNGTPITPEEPGKKPNTPKEERFLILRRLLAELAFGDDEKFSTNLLRTIILLDAMDTQGDIDRGEDPEKQIEEQKSYVANLMSYHGNALAIHNT